MGGHAAGSGLNGAPPPPIRYLTVARLRRGARHAALSPLRRAGSRDADASGQTGHHLTWSLFDDGNRRQRDFLWAAVGHYEYVVLSARPPSDRHNLFELGRTRLYWPRLAEGSRYRFRLRASPRVARSRTGGERSAKRDIVMDAIERGARSVQAATRDEGLRWPAHTGVKAGFEPAGECRADRHRVHRIGRPDDTTLTYATIEFEARLKVTDGERLRQSLAAGLGAGKAYGCGLLLLENWP